MGYGAAESPLARDLDKVMSRAGASLEAMRGKRLFVTGGTGFFGRWVLESLVHANRALARGLSVVVLTRNVAAFRAREPALAASRELSFLEGDVRSFRFPEGRFDFEIHAATDTNAKLHQEDPLGMFDTIVEGTRRALDFAREAGRPRVLFTSSGAVYGKQSPEIESVDEDYQGAPSPSDAGAAYGHGKRAAEHLCALYGERYGVECTIARCFAFVGPHLPIAAHFAIGNFIRDGLGGRPIRVSGDGTPYRSYLYAADLAAWLLTILVRGVPNRPYNVGSDEGLTIAELATRVGAHFGVGVEIARRPPPGRPAERYVPCIRRAREELSLAPWTGLDEAIARTARWHEARG